MKGFRQALEWIGTSRRVTYSCVLLPRLLGVLEVGGGLPRAVVLVELLPLDLVLRGTVLEGALTHHLLHFVLLGVLLLGRLLGLPRVTRVDEILRLRS